NMSGCRSMKGGESSRHDGSWVIDRQVARQLGRSDCVVRRCETSGT
ncbi:hypothetical protein TNCV_1484941, partial [Trichonephila clavipes]